jgi:vacuolar protein sorting-associated protein IST1
LFTLKYGKPFADAARAAVGEHKVSEKLMHKLAIQAPPKLLVENYLIEIAKNYNVEYEPDPLVMQQQLERSQIGGHDMLIDLSDRNNLNGPQPVGFIGYPQAPSLPQMPCPPATMPFNYPVIIKLLQNSSKLTLCIAF